MDHFLKQEYHPFRSEDQVKEQQRENLSRVATNVLPHEVLTNTPNVLFGRAFDLSNPNRDVGAEEKKADVYQITDEKPWQPFCRVPFDKPVAVLPDALLDTYLSLPPTNDSRAVIARVQLRGGGKTHDGRSMAKKHFTCIIDMSTMKLSVRSVPAARTALVCRYYSVGLENSRTLSPCFSLVCGDISACCTCFLHSTIVLHAVDFQST